MKKTIRDFAKMKADGVPVAWITAYDYPLARCAQNAGVDMILVGDSGGMVQLGYGSTNPVTMDEMILFCKAVRRGADQTFIVGDMPQGSYEPSNEEAVRSALRFIKEGGCDCVKLEGGERMENRVKAIVDAGIPVIGHLGLTPQSSASFGGYRVQCKTVDSFERTAADAVALVKAGAFAILLEAVPRAPAKKIAQWCRIPIYGIGAGVDVDGQLIIAHDLLGYYDKFRPKFAECYVLRSVAEWLKFQQPEHDVIGSDGLLGLAQHAIGDYVRDVKARAFPADKHTYPMSNEELDKVKASSYWM